MRKSREYVFAVAESVVNKLQSAVPVAMMLRRFARSASHAMGMPSAV